MENNQEHFATLVEQIDQLEPVDRKRLVESMLVDHKIVVNGKQGIMHDADLNLSGDPSVRDIQAEVRVNVAMLQQMAKEGKLTLNKNSINNLRTDMDN